MSSAAPPRHARRMRALNLLRITLVIGAVYDFVFAFLMVAAPELPEKLFELPQPGEFFYLAVMAIFLTMLGASYLLAAREPRRYSGIIVIAFVGRFIGAAMFATIAMRNPELWGLYALAAGDFLIALSHAVLFKPALG